MSDRDAAPELFSTIAPQYSWAGALMSLGQDTRWRRFMVARLGAVPGSLVLDLAAGTGLVSREVAARARVRVVALDPSEAMLRAGLPANDLAGLSGRIEPVLGRAEMLPFADGAFDAVTFTYLVRYLDDPGATMREIARVVRPGGSVASLEFHVPQRPLPRVGWYAYTRGLLPVFGALVSSHCGGPERSSGRASAGSRNERRFPSRCAGGTTQGSVTSARASWRSAPPW